MLFSPYSIYELFDSVPEGASICDFTIDPKSELQIFVQQNYTTLPKYVTDRIGGEDHRPEFRSRVFVGTEFCGEGRGSSKKDAEKQAAESALAKLKKGKLRDL
jgi:ribonuclease III